MKNFLEKLEKESEKIEKKCKLEDITFVSNQNTSTFDLFDTTPVPLEEFLYSEEYLGLEKLSDKQFAFIEAGTQIYYEETLKMLGWKIILPVSELVALWGKGSGKDFCSAIICSRVAYLLLCLKDPLGYFGQSKFSHIDLLNMAYSSDQAESNFFAYFIDIVENSKWFRGKYKVKGDVVKFEKKIRAFSGNSYEETFEGKNLLICVLDEIAAFKTNAEIESLRKRKVRAPRYSASAVYDMAATSIASRFPKGIGKLIALSFPRYSGDFIEQLYAKGKDDPSCFASFGATWEVNPKRKRADFDDEFRRNPERSAARYECKTSEKLTSFFKKPEVIVECFKTITADENPVTDDRTPTIKKWFTAMHNFPCAMHIDLGWKKDAAGICMTHCSELLEREDAFLPIVKIDLVTSFIAPVNGEIDFETVRDFVLELIKRGFNLRLLTLDGFQSVWFLQTFAKKGIETKLRSVDRSADAYDDLKSMLYEKRIREYFAPRTLEYAGVQETRYELKDELENLLDMGGKKGPDHKMGGVGKDIADALAGAVQGAMELGYSSFSKEDIVEGSDRLSLSLVSGIDRNSEREYLTRPTEESW